MKYTKQRLKVLQHIGRNPQHSEKDIAEETGVDRSAVQQQIYTFRSHGLVVKAPDRDAPMQWRLTGKGRRELVEELRQFNPNVTKEEFDVFRPIGVR